MKITSRIYQGLLVVCMIGSIPQIVASENSNNTTSAPETISEKQQEEALNAFFDHLLEQSLELLNNIDKLLEEFQCVVAANGVAALKIANTKEAVITWTKQTSLIVKQHHDIGDKVLHTVSDEAQAFKIMLVGEIRSLISYIEQTYNNGFTKLTPYVPAPTRTQFTSLNAVEDQLEKNRQAITALHIKMENVGLQWYNKGYRAVDKYLIKPAQNHYFLSPFCPWIGSRTKIIVGTAALYYYIKWKTAYLGKSIPELDADLVGMKDVKWLDRRILKWLDLQGTKSLRQLFAFPHQTNNGQALDYVYHDANAPQNHPLGKAGVYEYLFSATAAAPIALKLYEWTGPAYQVESYRICEWFDQKTTVCANWLKGGAYLQKDSGLIKAPSCTLDDAIGLTEVKKAFEDIIQYFENPNQITRAKLIPEFGFLLTGGSRTGKTFIAECLAGSIREMYKATGRDPNSFGWYPIHASLINEKGIEWIMERAKECAPCILFIDEIDLLGLQRTGDSKKLSEFLVTLNDCFKNSLDKPIVLITATNRPQNLDFALRQPGRLGKEIRFEYPKAVHRREFLSKKLDELTIDSSQFDLDRLVIETESYSYEAMNILFRTAFCHAKKDGKRLEQQHLDDAFDRELRKILFNGDEVIAEQDTQLLAAHIAGNALAVELLNKQESIAKVTILPYEPRLNEEHVVETMIKAPQDEQEKKKYGHVFTNNLYDTTAKSIKPDRLISIQCLLAGFIAEELLLGSPSSYRHKVEDAQQAMRLAEEIVSHGVDIHKFTEELKTIYIQQALVLKEQCKKDATALLIQYRPALEALNKALLEKRIISGLEIKQIIANAMAK